MFYLFICFHLSLFLDCFQVNPRMGRHAHAITLIRSAIGQRSTTPPNYVLSAALHAGGSVEQAIQILESYADIVSPRQDISMRRGRTSWGRGHVGPPTEIIAPQPPQQPPLQPAPPAPASIPPQKPSCLGEITISSEEEPPSADTSRTDAVDYTGCSSCDKPDN
nr:PREDICTED: uncharacterized protein LOC109030051 isoform X2 [Bemisia tabaci]